MKDAAIAVFARLPVHGRVKTRLARTIGVQPARDLHRACLQSTALLVDTLPKQTGRYLYCTGPVARALPAARRLGVPKSFTVRAQARGNLGRRLAQAFRELLEEGYQRVLILGSDSPTLQRKNLLGALSMLKYFPTVIGRADDGGFVSVGARWHHPEMLAGIDWGTGRAFEQALANFQRFGIRTMEVVGWYDVDRPDDLVRLERDVRLQPQVKRLDPLRDWFRRRCR